MRRLFSLAAALACACAMPELPEGYQLQCYDDAECPVGTACSQLCCVKPGERPTCLARGWGGGNSGGPCTNDTQCPQGLTCFSEAVAGPVGGLCTRSCVNQGCHDAERCQPLPALAAAAGLDASDFCMPQCSGGGGCRPGFGCACEGSNCTCVPACSPSGDGSCEADSASGQLPRSCEPTSGLCVAVP